MMCTTAPLERWVAARIRSSYPLSRSELEAYQFRCLLLTVAWARQKSSFYRRQLKQYDPAKFTSLADLRSLPFTTASDLYAGPERLLCVHPEQIARIVTLFTSGTTGEPKRIFFTAADQERMIDFFHHGMNTLVAAGDRVLILLPGQTPGSVGELLKRALARAGVRGIVYGPVRDVKDVFQTMAREKSNCLVGVPAQLLVLARCRDIPGPVAPGTIKAVLLCSDYIPAALVQTLQNTWACKVFSHYGMTETGFSGGVECEARSGYHLCEADLLFEIIDPQTGQVLPAGETGEVVITTLTTRGMPFIRYRTGDISRFLPGPCPCGSVLRRLDRILYRRSGLTGLKGGGVLTMGRLDEVLLGIDGLLDFSVKITAGEDRDCLTLNVYLTGEDWEINEKKVQIIGEGLHSIPAIREASRRGELTVGINLKKGWENIRGMTKRVIDDRRCQA